MMQLKGGEQWKERMIQQGEMMQDAKIEVLSAQKSNNRAYLLDRCSTVQHTVSTVLTVCTSSRRPIKNWKTADAISKSTP